MTAFLFSLLRVALRLLLNWIVIGLNWTVSLKYLKMTLVMIWHDSSTFLSYVRGSLRGILEFFKYSFRSCEYIDTLDFSSFFFFFFNLNNLDYFMKVHSMKSKNILV